jgi:hypothetical protein
MEREDELTGDRDYKNYDFEDLLKEEKEKATRRKKTLF